MVPRLGWLLVSFLVLNTTGCALLQVVVLPVKLLFSLLGTVATGLGSVVGIAYDEPPEGPPAVVREVGEDRWLVEGLREDEPCKITCSAPGHQLRVYSWPQHFADREGSVVVVRLQASNQ